MTELLVGCPVRQRGWILRPWFLFVEQAALVAGLRPSYIVALAKADIGSREVIEKCCADAGRDLVVIETGEGLETVVQTYKRLWTEVRYGQMVQLRNLLLGKVRELEPKLFLSLDSDILIHEQVLANLASGLETFDAMGGKCYMEPQGVRSPSYAMLLNANGLLREDANQVIPVDCIMAIKLMTPRAYGVDYRYHFQGEDIGWSVAAREQGLTLGWDGRIVSKHVMQPSQLELIDPRCGY
jgi:hypothetical protein